MTTDPAADAAKLLPCPFPWRGDDGSIEQCIERNHCGCGKNTRPQPAPPAGEPLSDAQIKHMVDRFLAWRLPKPWTPDNGISYVRPSYMHPPADHDWPTGTNLFDWSQAEAMVRYMIEGMTGLATRAKVEDAEVAYAIGALRNPAFMAGDGAPQHKAEQCRSDRETAADLLERLAMKVTVLDARDTAWSLQCQEVEAKLADAEHRENDLAETSRMRGNEVGRLTTALAERGAEVAKLRESR